ncbi:MAG: hypothetical protein KC733_12585, partial [Candidatus Omnitrophica bacterium]|nr:hypothetical protein [Candidatus Omnitrophota bacterium]
SWMYGLLMPHYYSTFFKIFGVSINTALLGQNILILLSGILIFLICNVFITAELALVCASWYWIFRGYDFFYSYHHAGGIVVLLATIYFLFCYIKNQKQKFIIFGFISLFLLLLVRPNLGITSLFCFIFGLLLTDFLKKSPRLKTSFITSMLLSLFIIATSFFAYWLAAHSLPKYALNQSFPYLIVRHAESTSTSIWPILARIGDAFAENFLRTWKSKLLAGILCITVVKLFYLLITKKIDTNKRTELILIFTSLLMFSLFSLHEFLLSGITFRINWGKPIFIIIIFFLIHYFMEFSSEKIFSPLIKGLCIITLFTVSFYHTCALTRYINGFKHPSTMLNVGKNQIYTSQAPEWFQTVHQTCDFINQHVPANDKILALPHSSLYYFLTNHDGATRQLDFFEHSMIPPEQEQSIITELEQNNLQWIILSNRYRSPETDMGFFGETHCKILFKYIEDHFETVTQFGDWNNPNPGWAWNHGVKILKRR